MAPSDTEKQFWNVRELAKYLDVSERTVERLIASGKLKAVRIGRLLRISDDDLQEFLRRNSLRKSDGVGKAAGAT